MGQYHFIVNLDKREFIDPHQLDVGLKAWEQMVSHPSTPQALFALLLCSNGRGGGDLGSPASEQLVIGRWAGDRLAVVGDYAEDFDLEEQTDPPASEIYDLCRAGEFLDVSDLVRPVLAAAFDVEYEQETIRVQHLDGSRTEYSVWRLKSQTTSETEEAS